jgi:hypothetical protein
VIDALHAALRTVDGEGSARIAVERVLARHGSLRSPRIEQRREGGVLVRTYRWQRPGGDVLLTVANGRPTGVAIGSHVESVEVIAPEPPAAVPLNPSPFGVPSMYHRHNPNTVLTALKAEVASKASEQSQVNSVVRALAAAGYAHAATPEVHTTAIDRSTYRIYLWRSTPFGDHLVLATGPSFEPSLLLGSEIPTNTEPGFYVHAAITQGSAVKPLAGAARAAQRTTHAASAHVAEREAEAKAAEKQAKAAEKEAKAQTRAADAARRKAEADAERERERADRARAEADRDRERAERERERERSQTQTVTVEDKQAKALAQAQALIAALKAGKGK